MNNENLEKIIKENDQISVDSSDDAQGGAKGALIGTIIVIILLVAGAVYIFTSKTEESNKFPEDGSAEDIIDAGDTKLDALTRQADSDEINSIENDLNETDLSGLDLELSIIEDELESVLGL